MLGQKGRVVRDINYTSTSESSTPNDLVQNIRSFLDRNSVTLVGPFTMQVRYAESQAQRSLTLRLFLEAELTAAAPPTPDHTPRHSETRAASVEPDSRCLFQLTSASQFSPTSFNSPVSGDTLSAQRKSVANGQDMQKKIVPMLTERQSAISPLPPSPTAFQHYSMQMPRLLSSSHLRRHKKLPKRSAMEASASYQGVHGGTPPLRLLRRQWT
jgi:hypothetical protein